MSYITNKNFVKAVKYIYANIDKAISLEELASSLGLSMTSMKRLFQETMEQSPGTFIRNLRMELAFPTLKNRDNSILEVALASGFSDHSAFSRRFKEAFGYSPAQARKTVNIMNELDCITLKEPEIIELVDFTIQCITEKGLYYECAPKAWDKLKESLNTYELSDDFSGLFIGIGHDNPHEGSIKEDQVRFTAGVSLVERDLQLNHMKITGGHYARFSYTGKPANLGLAYHYIYGKWAETSNIKLNFSIPAFQVFDQFPNALNEHKIYIYIYMFMS